MYKLLPVLMLLMLSACGESAPTTVASTCGVYAIGPNQIKAVLASGQAEPAPGRTAKAELPADFPAELLDAAGFYRGMAVYCSADEAHSALSNQKQSDWGVFELASDWGSNVYQADDGALPTLALFGLSGERATVEIEIGVIERLGQGDP